MTSSFEQKSNFTYHQQDILEIYNSLDVIRPQAGFTFVGDVETGTCISRGEVYATDDSGYQYTQNYADQAWLMMPSKDVQLEDQEAGWWCELESTSWKR